MKYYIQICSWKISAVRFGTFVSGVWIQELPLLALDLTKALKVLAFGTEALRYLEEDNPGIVVCNPFESLESWIVDLEFVETYVRCFQRKLFGKKLAFIPPLAAVQLHGYGRESYEVEKRAIKESFIHAGAREVWLLPSDKEVSFQRLKSMKRSDFIYGDKPEMKIPQSIIIEWVEPVGGANGFPLRGKP